MGICERTGEEIILNECLVCIKLIETKVTCVEECAEKTTSCPWPCMAGLLIWIIRLTLRLMGEIVCELSSVREGWNRGEAEWRYTEAGFSGWGPASTPSGG